MYTSAKTHTLHYPFSSFSTHPPGVSRAQQAQAEYAKAQPTGRDLFRFLANPMGSAGGGLDQTAYRLDFGGRAQTAASQRRDLPPGTAVTVGTQTDYRYAPLSLRDGQESHSSRLDARLLLQTGHVCEIPMPQSNPFRLAPARPPQRVRDADRSLDSRLCRPPRLGT